MATSIPNFGGLLQLYLQKNQLQSKCENQFYNQQICLLSHEAKYSIVH